jgi:hypothetical protein
MAAVNNTYAHTHNNITGRGIGKDDRIMKPRNPRPCSELSTLLMALLMLLRLQPVNARICVSVPANGDDYHHNHQCTDDPLVLAQAVDPATGLSSNKYNLGLDQRIDGTESEKQSIIDVLVRMDEYYIHEVLAHPEYASVRNRWYVFYQSIAFIFGLTFSGRLHSRHFLFLLLSCVL